MAAAKKKAPAKKAAKKVLAALAPANPLLGLSAGEVFRKVHELEESKNIDIIFSDNVGSIRVEPRGGSDDDFGFFAEAEEMPGCCAVIVLHDLSYPETALTAAQIELLALGSVHTTLDARERDIAVATTNGCNLAVESLLSTIGFKVVEKGHNPSSGNDITLWSFTRNG